jgi:hypothetical protein
MSCAATVRAFLLISFGAFAPLLAGAATVNVDFDEFTSPPVTCCFKTTGVTGALHYPTVLVDGGASGAVMSGDGWAQAQTSGANLYGTQGDNISLVFHQASSALSLDVINGSGTADYTVALYDLNGVLLDSSTQSLAGFGGDAGTTGVGHFMFSDVGVYSAVISTAFIDGANDFAIDTISFQTGLAPVPEPSSMLFMMAGVASLFAALRRRRCAV